MSTESIINSIKTQVDGYVSAVTNAANDVGHTVSSGLTSFHINPGFAEVKTAELTSAIAQLSAETDRIKSLSADLLGRMPALDFGTAPTIPALNLPAAPTFVGSAAIIPTAPSIMQPTLPTAPVLTIPVAPSIIAPNMPTAPVLVLPTAPVLRTDIVIPAAPDIILPSWDATFVPPIELKPLAIDLSLLTPESDVAWTSTEHTLLLALINNGLTNSPLPGTEELELYNRARNRLTDEYEERRNEISQRFAALNYPAPPGAQLASLQRLNEKEALALNDINVTIMDTQLKLRIQSQQYYTDMLYKVEDQAQKWLADVRVRIQSMLTKIIDARIQQYNANLRMIDASVEIYKANLAAFSEQIRAAGLAVDIYRGQLEGAKLLGELNQQDVSLYSALVGAQESVVRMYSTQLQAVDAQVKVQLAAVGVYNAQLDGVKATADVYDSQIRAYAAGTQAGIVQSQIYATNVNAWQTGEEIRIKQFDAALQQTDAAAKVELAKLVAYNNAVSAYKTGIDVVGARMDAWGKNASVITSTGTAVIDAISAMGTAASRSADLAVAQSMAINKSLVDSAAANATYQAARMRAAVEVIAVQGDAAQSGIAALGQMGAGIILKVE